MQKFYEIIKAYIEDNREPMMKLWEELVNTESGPNQKEGVTAVCDILRREMESADISTRIIPMERVGDVLIGEWNLSSTKEPFVFLGHMDTVFPAGSTKETPFRIDENGHAYGPGVLDMKGGVVIALYAIKALASAGYQDRPIKMILAGDEETLHRFSTAKEAMISEITGAAACFNFETGYPDEGFVVGRKGGGRIVITITGVAAHSGIAPEKGRNAILEAAHKIIALESATDIPRGKLLNCGQINGGIGENTIPGACEIALGFRFPTMAIKAELMQIVEEVVKNNTVPDTYATYKIDMCADCMETTQGVIDLFDHLKQVATACGYGDIHSFTVGGISDSSISVACGVPTVCGMGCKGVGNHTPHEYAEVESLFQRCALAACAVYSY